MLLVTKLLPPLFPRFIPLSGVLLAFLQQLSQTVSVGVWTSGFHVGHCSQQERHDVCDSRGGGLHWRLGWRVSKVRRKER